MRLQLQALFVGLCVSTLLTTCATPNVVTFTQETGRLGNRIGWLSVPEKNDSVLTLIDKNGNLFYINPDIPGAALPHGLYFWKSDLMVTNLVIGKKLGSVVRPSSRSEVGYEWGPGNVYSKKRSSKSKIIRKYKPSKRVHPSRRVAAWVADGGPHKFVAGLIAQPKQLPGAVITDAANNAEIQQAACLTMHSKKAWTPLHEAVYQELLDADVADALKAVLLLKKQKKALDVAATDDATNRTLHRIALDVNDELKGALARQPGWYELMRLLQPQ